MWYDWYACGFVALMLVAVAFIIKLIDRRLMP